MRVIVHILQKGGPKLFSRTQMGGHLALVSCICEIQNKGSGVEAFRVKELSHGKPWSVPWEKHQRALGHQKDTQGSGGTVWIDL